MPETPDTIDDALDALVDPTTSEVLESTLTRDFSAREIAAAAVTRGGGAQTLQQVLTAGNDAGGLSMTNVGAIAASDLETTDDLEAGGSLTAAGGSFSVDADANIASDSSDGDVTLSGYLTGDLGIDELALGNSGSGNISLRSALVAVSVNSVLRIAKTTAPADGDLAPSTVAIWFDATNGAAKLMIKGKSADGTVVTGQVALT